MALRTEINTQEAAKMGEMIFTENKRLTAENEKLAEKNDKLSKQLTDLTERYKGLRQFEPLLKDAPEVMQVYLQDAKIVVGLQARALKLYGKAGEHPDEIQGNEKLRRQARMNYETIVNAALRYAFAHWNSVVATFIRPVKI